MSTGKRNTNSHLLRVRPIWSEVASFFFPVPTRDIMNRMDVCDFCLVSCRCIRRNFNARAWRDFATGCYAVNIQGTRSTR